MIDIDKHTVNTHSSIKDALVALDALKTKELNLFVIEENGAVVGSVTDGDIRRGFIRGAQMDSPVTDVMNGNFIYFGNGAVDLEKFHYYKSKGISLIPVLDSKRKIESIYNLRQLESVLPIDAVLMAGGKGERLRPLTEKTPKPLLPVGDKAIIDYNIDRLISYGVKNICVTVNYLKEQIEKHFREPYKEVQIRTVREPQYLGTVGSVRFVPEFYNDTVLVMNSDLFTNINYEDFYLHFKEHDADMSIAAVPYSVQVPYGIFLLEGRRDVKGIIEKPTYDYYANAGIYLIKKSALEYVPEGMVFNATDLIEALIDAGRKVIRFPLNGTWIDIGNPQEYKRANDMVRFMH